MKKILSTLFVLFCILNYSIAETGYKSIPWFSTINECKNKIILEESKDEYSELLRNTPSNVMLLYVNETVILGRKNKVSYEFIKDKNTEYLIGISYIINNSQLSELLKKLPEPSHKSSFSWDFEYMLNESSKSENLELTTEEGKNELYKISFTSIAQEIERNGTDTLIVYDIDNNSELYNEMIKEMPTFKVLENKGNISIHEYNDDTRMYIFDKIIKDKVIIVYVHHEQDYWFFIKQRKIV